MELAMLRISLKDGYTSANVRQILKVMHITAQIANVTWN